MSGQFHQQQDGTIWVRDLTRNLHYHGTKAEFEAAQGVTLPALPSGCLERIYDQNKRHAFLAPNIGVKGGDVIPWALGDAAIANIDHLISTMPIPPSDVVGPISR